MFRSVSVITWRVLQIGTTFWLHKILLMLMYVAIGTLCCLRATSYRVLKNLYNTLDDVQFDRNMYC